MGNSESTRKLLETYYEGFAKKEGWESVIAEDFEYIGGDMMETTPTIGKDAYIKVINRFSKVYQTMRVKKMVVEGDSAFVVGNYDLLFPNGASMNGDVAEVWEAKNGKLASLRIFFDTLTFQENTPT